jgi:hypothetical protein
VVMLKYYSPVFSVEVLCNLFARIKLNGNNPKIPAIKARIRLVVSKVVDSLHLYTVNIG